MVRIVTESSSDLPDIVTNHFNISIIPARILFGRDKYQDGVNLDSVEFYQKLRTTRFHPVTTQASPMDYFKIFRELEEEGEDILVITLPRGLSAMSESAKIAASNISGVRVKIFDSQGVSMMQGLVALQAARLTQVGFSIDVIIDKLNLLVPKTLMYALVKTIDYLAKGGRVSTTRAKIGNFMGVNPLLLIKDGKVGEGGKARGMEHGLEVIVDSLKLRYSSDEPIVASVVNALNPSLASKLSDSLNSEFNIVDMIHSKIGPTIGIHSGPGAVGAAFSPALSEIDYNQ